MSKKIGLWANQFRRVRQSCIRRVQRNLLSIFHWKNDDFWMKFVLWAKKFRTLPKFYCSFPKLQSTCQEKNCERRKSWKIDDYLVILKLWVKKLDSEQNNWVGVVKTTFGVSRGILWQFFIEKRMVFDRFSHFERKSSGPCQTFTAGFSKLQSTCPEKNIESGKIWEIDDFVIILYFELKKWILGKTILQGLSLLHSAFSEETFEQFCLEKRWFLTDFRTLSENVPGFAKNWRQGVWNFNLRVRRKFWEKKNEKMMISQ